jgi:hypothetical protein
VVHLLSGIPLVHPRYLQSLRAGADVNLWWLRLIGVGYILFAALLVAWNIWLFRYLT